MVNANLTQELIQLSQQYVDAELSQILSTVWDKVSVVLGGSICFGGADKFSDLDLFVIASTGELKKLLPVSTQYKNQRLGVEIGYSWDEIDGYLNTLPANADSLFGEIQHSITLHDPGNRYKTVQERLNQYLPDDFWKAKLLKKLFGIFYTSENGLLKALKRNDPITAQIWEGELMQNIMELTFLLNREYVPSKKWLHLNFLKLPLLSGELEPYLKKIIEVSDIEEMERINKAVWDLFNQYIKEKNLLPTEVADKPWKFV